MHATQKEIQTEIHNILLKAKIPKKKKRKYILSFEIDTKRSMNNHERKENNKIRVDS